MVALLYQTSSRSVAFWLRWIGLFTCTILVMVGWPSRLAAVSTEPPPTPSNLICTDVIEDSTISRPRSSSPWQAVRNEVLFTTASARVFSAPQAIYLVEDDDGDGDGSTDVDAFRQRFTVPSAAEQIIGTIRYRIVPGALGPNDTVTIALNVPDDPTPAGRVFAVDIPLTGKADGNWRSFSWAATDITPLVEQGAAQLIVTMRGVRDGTGLAVSFDDIEVQLCSRNLATLSGRVTQSNRESPDLRDVRIFLVRSGPSGRSVIATAQVEAADDGFRYQFSVPPLSAGAAYQVWFINQPLTNRRDGQRLSVLAGPVVTELGAGDERTDLDLELSSPRLLDPQPNARLVLNDDSPVRFLFEPRSIDGEEYQICLYDPTLFIPETGLPPQWCSPPLTAAEPYVDLVPSIVDTMPLRYGHPYRWYVKVLDRRGTETLPAYGYSFAERTITFLSAPASLPMQVIDNEGLPAGADPVRWTILIYVAADNALGDPLRTSVVARPDFELERLRLLAAAYPDFSIVTFYDAYGITGGQICAFRGSAVDCRRQFEPNSTELATLREFVRFGLSEFPAARTMLILVGPAHPAFGFGSDESVAATPAMSITDLGVALREATVAAEKRIDLVLFQAPLMANLNTALALAPAADYLVAPPGNIWRTAWIHRVLSRLTASDGDNPRAVAVDLPTIYSNAVRSDGVLREYALTALDLDRADEVRSARDDLATALQQIWNERAAVIQLSLLEVRSRSTVYDSSGNGLADAIPDPTGQRWSVPEDAFIDLGDFTAALANAPVLQDSNLAAVRTATINLSNALGGSTPLVLATRRNAAEEIGIPSLPPGAGLAEFFPHRSLFGTQPVLVESLLYRGQTDPWSGFIRSWLASDLPVGIGGVTTAPSGGIAFPLITGLPIAYDRYLPIISR
ncbi:MAG: hypothetical protein J7456_02120 [Chloroflexus sp.]|nr:hypothetical protein [Chloroflexus sp.]